jgi:hypothetical protein
LIPTRYLIATLFIAALLLLMAVVQAPRSAKAGGVATPDTPTALTLDSFEVVAELPIEDGWAPRFQGTRDPDQADPWPFEGGFGAPWEPASPYLGDQGVALNGPKDRSQLVLWRGLEWRHYRFDLPLTSARLHPRRPNRLLVTLQSGAGRFETRLLELPEGRLLWSVDSGPWSRFSWDGTAILIGLADPETPGRLLLSSLRNDSDKGESSLAAWDEPGLPAAPRGWPVKPEQLWYDGRDQPGASLLVPWGGEARLWMPSQDRLWVADGPHWTLWGLEGGAWRRLAAGTGILEAHPPQAMGLVRIAGDGSPERAVSGLRQAEWVVPPGDAAPWPAYDPAWYWRNDRSALSAWDLRWNEAPPPLPAESQREALRRRFKGDWRTGQALRVSLKGWLPHGAEVAMREPQGAAWVWVGQRVVLANLRETERVRTLRRLPGLR